MTAVGVAGYLLYLGEHILALISTVVFGKLIVFHADSWQKSLGTSGLDQMNAYGEMMMKFADTWNSMWPQPG